jgi:hypothetical protein
MSQAPVHNRRPTPHTYHARNGVDDGGDVLGLLPHGLLMRPLYLKQPTLTRVLEVK